MQRVNDIEVRPVRVPGRPEVIVIISFASPMAFRILLSRLDAHFMIVS